MEQIPRKVDAKLLNWKTVQEAGEKNTFQKCLLLKHTHTHTGHGKNEPNWLFPALFPRRGLGGQRPLGNKALVVLPSAEPDASSVAQGTELNCLFFCFPPFLS